MGLKTIFSAATLITAVLLAGCSLRKSNPLDLTHPHDIEVPALSAEQITFKVVESQVLKDHCVSCHSEKSGNKGGVNLETYENVLKDVQSIRAEVLSKSMPPSRFENLKLSEAQIKLVIDWIDNGAKENDTDQGAIDQPPVIVTPPPTTTPPVVNPPVTEDVVFADILEKIFKPNCVKCHSDATRNRGDVNLETYANVISALSDIKSDVETDQMPPKPPRGTPLTDEQKKMLFDWIEKGAKEK